MANDNTMSASTGSLPKGLQFLQHGAPGPQPKESQAELERAEQAEYNLFVEDGGNQAADAVYAAYTETEEKDYTANESQTESIARIVASVFAGVKAAEPQVSESVGQTDDFPEVVASMDASRPLPYLDILEKQEETLISPEPFSEQVEQTASQNTGKMEESKADKPSVQKNSREKVSKPVSQKNPRVKAAKPGAAKKKHHKEKISITPDTMAGNRSGGTSAPLPGTNVVKITDTGVRDSASFSQLLQDIRERQKEAMPSAQTSVKSTMKRLQVVSSIDQHLNPLRYIILVLMVLCLAGRKYQWMTLGFMSDMQGVRFAILLTAISMLLSWQSVRRAFRDALYLKASYETWLFIASLLTAMEALLHSNADSLMPVLAISWCFSGFADCKNEQTELRTYRFLSKAKSRTGLRMRQGGKNGKSMIGKAKSTTHGFVCRQEEPDVFHKIWMFTGPVLFLIMLILTAVISGRTSQNYFKIFVTLIDMATPTALVVCCARPYELLSLCMRRNGVVAGWYGMQQLSGKRYMLLYDSDFYPTGTIRKKDVRLHMSVDYNTAVAYAASLGLKGNIGYHDMFENMLSEVHGQMTEVYGLRVFERGVQGRIHQETVLLGSYEFMQLEGFQIPAQAQRDSLFLAIGQKLAAEIVISYQVKRGADSAFRHLLHEPGLYTMVAARNFMITPGYIGKNFKTGIGKMVCQKSANRRKLAQSDTMDAANVCGFVFREGIAAYGLIVAGARRTWRAGFWMSIFSVVTAVFLMIRTALTFLQNYPTPIGTGLIALNLILIVACELVSRLSAGNPD